MKLIPILLIFSVGLLSATERPPNIVIMLADDLGIECLSSYGGRSHATPNIDHLASEGMRFTHAFSNPTCSPSRASLLTGRYSFKHGVKRVIWDREKHSQLYLRSDQPSFARQLKAAGYATAIAGKWQLSFLSTNNTIQDFGFDEYQCWQIHTHEGAKTRRFHEPHFLCNGELIQEPKGGRYGPDMNVDFLIDFIERQSEADKPFLAYYTSLLPHYPWVPTPDSEDQDYTLTDNKGKGDPKYFSDMVAYMDKCLGRLMDCLEAQGIAENTIVLFLADNGTDQDLVNLWRGQRKIPGGKGTMTDRGTRVPLIVRWPGKVEAGSTSNDLVDFSDLLPTLCIIARAELPSVEMHGRSFLPQLLGQKGEPREWIHVQDYEKRHLRDDSFILTHKGRLRPAVEIWQPKAKHLKEPLTPEQLAAKDKLQAAFDQLND